MNERQGVKSSAGRIVSIDVLRGFDMLLLCGGAAVILKFLQWQCVGGLPGWLEGQFVHALLGLILLWLLLWALYRHRAFLRV